MAEKTFETHLPADLSLSSLVRSESEQVFQWAGFSQAWAARLKLVVDELFMNAVKYGSKENARVHLTYKVTETGVEFTMEDEGDGAKKLSADELKTVIQKNHDNNELTRTSGRGLAMITQAWTDGFSIETSPRGGLAVSFTKKKESAPPPALTVEAPPLPRGPVVELALPAGAEQYDKQDALEDFRAKLEALPAKTVAMIDFKNIGYINSIFLGHLAAWFNTLSEKQGGLRLKNVNAAIRDVIDTVGLSHIISVE